MRFKKTVLIILLIAFVIPGGVSALAADELLTNPVPVDNAIPSGWEIRSYLAENYSVASGDGEFILSAKEPDDLRLTQLVEVEENTAYLFSAQISASNVLGGRGATLSIDNYSLDGCYIYSKNIIGNSDWVDVDLVFRTGKGQTQILAALRLGGYSELSTGTVRFRNVSLTKAGEGVSALSLSESQSSSAAYSAADNGNEISEMRRYQLKSYLHLFIVVAVAAGVVMIFGFYRNRDRIASVEISDRDLRRFFILSVLAGCILRSVLASAWGGHDTDMSCWMGWGNYIAQNGFSSFYTAPGHEWYDYPPGYMYILGLIARIISLLRIPGSSHAAVFAYMLPAFLADVFSGWMMMRLARENGFSNGWCLLLGAFCVFNPAAVMLSGAWGQIDSILALMLLLSFREFGKGRRISAGVFFALAVMVKWQALIYGPVLAAAYFLHIRSRRDVLETAAAVFSALLVILLLSLPFKGEQGLFWIVERFFNAAGGYDYASVEAYNFLALCGGNWKVSSSAILPGISYKAFGMTAILLSVVLSVFAQFFASAPALKGMRSVDDRYMLYLAAAFCMYGIFTFGHYMHERYVFPVLLLLPAVFILTREPRFLLCSMLLSAVLFLNEMTAMYVISNLASAVVRGGREHNAVVAACSALETASFIYFSHVAISFLQGKKERGGAVDE